MKKLIAFVLGIALFYSCSSNSDNNNSSSTGMLVKTIADSYVTMTFNYNGNKLYTLDNIGGSTIFTYNGNLIISSQQTNNPTTNPNGYNVTENYNYTNNLLTSLNYSSSMSNYNRTYTYNLDGTISENTTYQPSGSVSTDYTKRYFSQGNCVREDEFFKINGVWVLQYTTSRTFDNKNSPFINILGWCEVSNPMGKCNKNNEVGFIVKNGLGQITNTNQTIYVYNSQNYPIQIATTTTNYSINPQTGVSIPGSPTTENISITYY